MFFGSETLKRRNAVPRRGRLLKPPRVPRRKGSRGLLTLELTSKRRRGREEKGQEGSLSTLGWLRTLRR